MELHLVFCLYPEAKENKVGYYREGGEKYQFENLHLEPMNEREKKANK